MRLLESYLADRKQFVAIDEEKSKWCSARFSTSASTVSQIHK